MQQKMGAINGDPRYLRALFLADGIAVPETGYHLRDRLDTQSDDISSPLNNPPAGALLSVVEIFAQEYL